MGVVKTYPLPVAAEAAQIEPRKQRQLIDTGKIPLRSNDVVPGGSGNYCGLSRNKILQTAVTEAAWRGGVAISTAAAAAFAFSDLGSTGRKAGELYPVGKTILVINREDAVVRNILSDSTFSEISTLDSFTIVNLNRIVEHVEFGSQQTL